MSEGVVVYGAGGHGKVIADALTASGQKVLAFIDGNVSLRGSTVLDLPIYFADEWLRSQPGALVALGVGDNVVREQVAMRVKHCGCSVISVVHPGAIVARSAMIGEGVTIMAGAVLNPDCAIGDGVIINTSAIVEHDVRIDRYVHLSPNCAVGGGAQIGAFAHVGMGASVLPFKRVGINCVIGAGAVVVSDIPDEQVAYGVPARVQSKT